MNHLKRRKRERGGGEKEEEEGEKQEGKASKELEENMVKKRFMTLEWNHLTTSKLQKTNLAT